MKAYIKTNADGIPYNVDTFNAYQGFKELGFECLFFNKYEDLIEAGHNQEDLIVGDAGIMMRRLKDFDIKYRCLDFPAEIGLFLGRIIWATDIQTIRRRSELYPVFVKSLEDKRLSGRVVRNSGDLDDCVSNSDHYMVLCSDLINFISEWRVFVLYGKILDVRPYKGDWKTHCNPSVIKDAVQTYTSAPCAYSLDFGVTDDDETLLININEGLTSESYGLNPKVYAEFILTRWAELLWGIERSGFFNDRGKWEKGFENQRVWHGRGNGLNISKRFFPLHGLTSALRLRGFSSDLRAIALHRACRWG